MRNNFWIKPEQALLGEAYKHHIIPVLSKSVENPL